MKTKKLFALVLSVAMILSIAVVPAAAADTTTALPTPEGTVAPVVTLSDTSDHWAVKSIDRWAQYGVVAGDELGKFNPNADLTRGSLATILAKLLGLTVKAENTYADVAADAWYADAILKCTAAGIMKGDGVNANPENNISRQEAMVMIARALGLKPAKTVDLAAFNDAATVADWAAPYVTVMTKSGIVTGVGDQLVAPIVNINRASIMTILDKAVSDYVNVAGSYDKIVGTGVVVVTVPDVVLKGNTIAGSLLVAEGVGDGNFTLDNTKIAGNTTVRGGGVNSFIVKGGSALGELTISRVDGAVRVVTSGGSTIETTWVDDGKDDVILEGKLGNVSVEGNVPVTLKGATAKTVTATGKDANITVDKASKVETVATKGENTTLTVAGTVANVAATKEATGLNLNVSKGGEAKSVTTAASGSTVTNEGKVGQIAVAKGADTEYVAGKGTTSPKFTAEDKADLSATTVDAKAAKEAAAAAEKLAAEAKTEAEKKAADEAKAAADKAAAAAKKDEDKIKNDADKVTVKPVEPPVIKDDGAVTVPDPKPLPPTGGGGNNGGYVDPYTHVTTAQQLTDALAGTATMIQIDGTIGTADAVTYGVYAVARPVTIKGGTVYGSFVVTKDGATFDGVTVYNQGQDVGVAAEQKNAINAYCAVITIRNCTFISSRTFANGVVIFPSATAVTYTVTGNTFRGYKNVELGYSTSGLIITQKFLMSGKPFFGAAGSSFVPVMSEAEHQAMVTGNTFTNCKIGYSVSDWNNDNTNYHAVCVGIEGGDLDQLNLSKATSDSLFFVKGAVAAAIADKTILAGSKLIVLEAATLTISEGRILTVAGTLTNAGTIRNNGAITGTVTNTGAGVVVVAKDVTASIEAAVEALRTEMKSTQKYPDTAAATANVPKDMFYMEIADWAAEAAAVTSIVVGDQTFTNDKNTVLSIGNNRFIKKLPFLIENGKLKIAMHILACDAAPLGTINVKTIDGLSVNVTVYASDYSTQKLNIVAGSVGPHGGVAQVGYVNTVTWDGTNEKILQTTDRGSHAVVWTLEGKSIAADDTVLARYQTSENTFGLSSKPHYMLDIDPVNFFAYTWLYSDVGFADPAKIGTITLQYIIKVPNKGWITVNIQSTSQLHVIP